MKVLQRFLVAVAAVLVAHGGVSFALDTVNLTNGKSLTGRIIEETDEEVRLLIDDIEIPLRKSSIVSIIRDGTLQPVKPVEPRPESGPPNPTPVRYNAPTPTPSEGGPVPGVSEEGSPPGFPVPGNEPLIPMLLPLSRFRIVTGSVVNLRSGPGTTHERVSAVSRGTVLMEQEEEDQWLRCRAEDGREGWISSEYTRKASAVVAAVTGTRVNLRSGPATEHDIRGQLDRGELVVVIDRHEDWSHVRDLAGRFGWMSGAYLREVGDLQLVRPAIAEMSPAAAQSFLEKGFSLAWSDGAEPGWKHLSMVIENDTLVRNGSAVLLMLCAGAESATAQDGESFRSPNVTFQERFATRAALEDLGLSLGLLETAAAAAVAYVKGERGDAGWKLEVEVREKDAANCRLGLVVQEGLQRGAVAMLSR